MLTPDEVAFKRRQLASLREAHPDPAPHVAEAIARLEADTAAVVVQEDQLAAAHAIIAGLTSKLSTVEAANRGLNDTIAELKAQLAGKPKPTPKRKR